MAKKQQREHFTILVGSGWGTAETFDVICKEKDLETVALAHYWQKRKQEGRPIACVAKRGSGVNFNNFDFLYADCM